MKTAPTSDDRVDMTPVDYVAQAIVGLAQRPESMGRTYHLVNPRAVHVRDVYGAIRACGYDLEEVPFDAWRSSAIQWGTQSQDQSFAAFAHWLMLMTPAVQTLPTGPTAAQQPVTEHPVSRVTCDKTLHELQPLGLTCPVVDVDRLKKQVQFLVRKKLVTAPPGGQKAEARGPTSDLRSPTSNLRPPTSGLRLLVPLRTAWREGGRHPPGDGKREGLDVACAVRAPLLPPPLPQPDRCFAFMGWADTSPPSCRWRMRWPMAGRSTGFRP